MSKEIIALDIGTKRIGVARADVDTKIPELLDSIAVDGLEFSKITSLLKQYQSKILVIGMPRNSEGQSTKESERVSKVVKQLERALSDDIEVFFQDESLTSVESKSKLGTITKLGEIDSYSAAIILNDYVNKK